MTTIAWDGKTLAADRRVSFGSVSDGNVTKIVKRKKDGALAAAAGNSSMAAAFRRWFLNGERRLDTKPELSKDTETASGVIIRPNGVVEIHDQYGWFELETEKYANGSGWEIAIGAMHAGATAEEAVRIAAKLDGNTGDEVDVLELGK